MSATLKRLACCAVLGSLLAGPAVAQDDTSGLVVDLNKFEAGEAGGCRAFFLFRNRSDVTYDGFEMSLAIIDRAGVIDRLLTIDAAPLPAERTTLKLFEIPEIACEDVSEVLLHDIPVCQPQNAEPVDCYGILNLQSRTDAAFVQ